MNIMFINFLNTRHCTKCKQHMISNVIQHCQTYRNATDDTVMHTDM